MVALNLGVTLFTYRASYSIVMSFMMNAKSFRWLLNSYSMILDNIYKFLFFFDIQ